ncbi:MAG: long-chain acyl-CoA synthetase [Chloroflexota bacterium]|jgi:acyl-CoA synthetase (AMP-forming)/AMP-acid ligase II|nr:long-chain acyl-CoA synthetase [Chloroflexota bacterium]
MPVIAPIDLGEPVAAGTSRSIRGLVARRAQERAGAILYAEGVTGRVLSYRDVASRAEAWRNYAALAGLVPGHRVALSARAPLDFAAALIGLISAGLTVAPLSWRSQQSELGASLDALDADLLVADEGTRQDRVPQSGMSAPGLEAPGGPLPRFRPPPRPGPAIILASSGSTGTPKLIPLTETQLIGAAASVATHHGLRPGEMGYSALPLFHVNAEVVGLLATLVGSAGLVLDARFSEHGFWTGISHWGVTWINLVPAMVARLNETPGPAAGLSVRFARSASAPLARAVLERFEARSGVGILETYGATEAAGQITANPVDARIRRPGSVGLPVGVAVRVTDTNRRPVAAGALGSVEIGGPLVTRSYLRPGPGRQSRPAGREGWLATGDVGWVDTDGFLYLSGRSDDVINRGGEKVHPREIEEVLLRHPAVMEAAVVGRDSAALGEEPVAYVTTKPAAVTGLDRTSIRDELELLVRDDLSRHKRPVEIVFVDSLPVGPTGKVRRAELRGRSAL